MINLMAALHQRRGGGGCRAAAHQTQQNQNLKDRDFVEMMMKNFYLVYPSAEISH
jgi:hypothetical protein